MIGMERLFVVVCEDRHLDVQVEIYRTAEGAINAAREHAQEMGWRVNTTPPPGWLLHAENEAESDQIWVAQLAVQEQ